MADGHTVYQGIANRAPRYFEGCGHEIATFANPADIFMRIISVNYPKESKDEEKIHKMVKDYNKKCAPSVEKHMAEVSMVEFEPRKDNFSEPAFCT